MGRTQQTLDGLVLRTYDLGEADRLCIVLTRERGRIAARARAVRRLGSRMGSLLLPGRRLLLDVRESGGFGPVIVAARQNGDIADLSQSAVLLVAQQGIELLLLLTEDDDPLPEVFDLTTQFLHGAGADPSRALQAFQLRLFHVLGFLPQDGVDRRFAVLSDDERACVRLCGRTEAFATLCEAVPRSEGLDRFIRALLLDHTHRELRSTEVARSIARSPAEAPAC